MANDPRSPFSSAHPLAGKIRAGVKTTEHRARLPHQTMHLQEVPTVTMADRAQQMFSMKDSKGTRVYYTDTGVFNTVDPQGKSINFIQGLFKTTNLGVINFLQYFVDKGDIHYLELEEEPTDALTSNEEPRERSERQPGSPAGITASHEPDQQEPSHRLEAAPDSNRSIQGGGSEQDEQSGNGPAVSGSSGTGNDIPEPSSQDDAKRQPEHPVKPVSLMDKLRASR